MKEAFFRLVLAPLIRRNLRLRASGRWPDEWYWADLLTARWGMWSHPDYPTANEWKGGA